jgi:hypothetical protein
MMYLFNVKADILQRFHALEERGVPVAEDRQRFRELINDLQLIVSADVSFPDLWLQHHWRTPIELKLAGEPAKLDGIDNVLVESIDKQRLQDWVDSADLILEQLDSLLYKMALLTGDNR